MKFLRLDTQKQPTNEYLMLTTWIRSLFLRAAKHYVSVLFSLQGKSWLNWAQTSSLETKGRRYRENYTQITLLIIVADVSTKLLCIYEFLIWFCPCVLVLVKGWYANKLQHKQMQKLTKEFERKSEIKKEINMLPCRILSAKNCID